jgi:hypothetical protein
VFLSSFLSSFLPPSLSRFVRDQADIVDLSLIGLTSWDLQDLGRIARSSRDDMITFLTMAAISTNFPELYGRAVSMDRTP